MSWQGLKLRNKIDFFKNKINEQVIDYSFISIISVFSKCILDTVTVAPEQYNSSKINTSCAKHILLI